MIAAPGSSHPLVRVAGRLRLRPSLARGVVGVVGFLAAAEIAIRIAPVNTEFLPPSTTVLASAAGLLVAPDFLTAMAATAGTWLVGLALSVAIAVPLGVLLGSLPAVRVATRALVEFLRPIPPVALIPLVIVLFGAGVQMKLTLVVYGAMWPILFNTVYALSEVDPVATDTARAFGFGRLTIIRRVWLPSAAPFIATGVRVSMAIALIITISCGLLAGGENGIGIFIIRASSGAGHTDVVLAAAVLTGLLGYLGNTGLERTERALFGWHFARGTETP